MINKVILTCLGLLEVKMMMILYLVIILIMILILMKIAQITPLITLQITQI